MTLDLINREMFSALDKDGKTVYAEECLPGIECFCKVCGERLRLRKGAINRPHFAHQAKSNCTYDDRDNKTEWHIRMQEYFPKETREYLFIDEKTGEKHIADVYIAEKETVIEFQHSPITAEEFGKRTAFHISNHRRIVWVFDETAKNPEDGDLGRLRPDDLFGRPFPHGESVYRWQRQPRKCIQNGPRIIYRNDWANYAVYIYSGVENGDFIHRIIGEECNYEYITLSIHTILMRRDMDVDEFFYGEQHWLSQPDWKPIVEQYIAQQKELARIRNAEIQKSANQAFNRLLYSKGRRNRRHF